MQKEPIKNEDLKWIGVDFDGVLAGLSLPPEYKMQGPQEGTKVAIHRLVEMGFKPHMFTARHSADYQHLEDWYTYHDIPIRRITTGKDLFKWMIDDRAIEFDPARPEESWRRALEIIRTGKLPW